MKFTLSWLREHLDTSATVDEIARAMTAAGLEVEHVDDPGVKLAAFSVAKIVEAVQHPNADRLRVCQVDTRDGRKEIVCGAPNARAGLTTIYAPLGAYVPGSGITLEARPVRGVVSNGMLCSGRELEVSTEGDGIVELPGQFAVGASAAEVFGLEPVIDFEVTPNRPDWLGVAGIARDLAAAGVGRLKTAGVASMVGGFVCPVKVVLDAPETCPYFAGRLIRGVRNGPSPGWLQERLRSVGLRPINAVVDVTNFLTLDRCRPLHAYDAAKLVGDSLHVRLGRHGDHGDEHLLALDGKRYDLAPGACVIADAGGQRPIDLGGVMGGESTGCSEVTTEVFLESGWFDPVRTAETGRQLGIASDAQYRFARGVDPGFLLPGLDLATAMILELCGGEASEPVIAGAPPAPVADIAFDPAYVKRLSGLDLPRERILDILAALGFETADAQGASVRVTPPSWRRDVDGPADLVEEVTRIQGFADLPSTPLPMLTVASQGVLDIGQRRVRTARRALAALGYRETVGWSFTSMRNAELFGGGAPELRLANPIASDLDCMRPSALPALIEACGRNAARGFADCALFEIGPAFSGDRPADQWTSVAAVLAPHPPRDWQGLTGTDAFLLKGHLMSLLETIGAPALQIVQGAASAWWRPGQSARLQLGPKAVVAEFGALHPRVLKVLDVAGPVYAFELRLEAVPAPRRKGAKSRPSPALSPLMPLRRDFAFVTPEDAPVGDLVRAVAGADKALIASARVFDVYRGPGVAAGEKSVAIEIEVQPRTATLTDAEIEALSAKVVASAVKAGARLRS